jgi:hypothetical protein
MRALILFGALVCVQAQVGPPFMLDLRPVPSPGLPGLHSFVSATDGKYWLLLGGRTNGLHWFVQSSSGGTVPPPNAFPPAMANRMAWVLDPVTGRAWSSPLQNLPANFRDHLSAGNAQGYQDGDTLYVVGGYGLDTSSGSMTTFGLVTAVRVKETIAAILNGAAIDGFLQQTATYTSCPLAGTNAYNACTNNSTVIGKFNCAQYQGTPKWATCTNEMLAYCRTQQTAATGTCVKNVMLGNRQGQPQGTAYYLKNSGGGLEKVGSIFQLVFGQDFEGMYSVSEGDYGKWPVTQTYSQRVAAFQFTPQPLQVDLLNVVLQDPNDATAPFNRRDLNVTPAIEPSTGQARIVAFGGVFKPGQDTAYREPILIQNAGDPMNFTVKVDAGYLQMMSQYDCARVPLYDRVAHESTTLFLAGISLYYLDTKTGRLRMDEGLPFGQDLSALTLNAAGSWTEVVRSVPLGRYLGADAAFLRDPGISAAPNGVIYLDGLDLPKRVGWMFGGIESQSPRGGSSNGSGTIASNALFEVWLTKPGAAPVWIPTIRKPAKP